MSTLLHGDCRDAMRAMEPNSIDAIVCDPPYGLNFMGKDWDRPAMLGHVPTGTPGNGGLRYGKGTNSRGYADHDARRFQAWTEDWAREAFRVLKPGGRLLAFGGTRTHHRMVCAIEDAGFVIEDEIAWLYGSGFPKHKSKLKPAQEPICVAWKPDSKATPLNIDACRIAASAGDYDHPGNTEPSNTDNKVYGWAESGGLYKQAPPSALGRWPANVALGHMPPDENGEGGCVPVGTKRVKGITGGSTGKPPDGYHGWDKRLPRDGYADADGTETVAAWDCHPDCAVALLDAQSGERPTGAIKPYEHHNTSTIYGGGNGWRTASGQITSTHEASTGGASRFFLNVAPDAEQTRFVYVSKSSRRERNAGLDGLPEVSPAFGNDKGDGFGRGISNTRQDWLVQNHHPCVKPVALMAWLIRLVCKPGDTVLDPFMGSGTTGCAAALEGVNFVGIEQNAEYLEISRRRIAHWTPMTTPRAVTDLPLFAEMAAD